LHKILVIRLSSIGDIVHTLPAVAALGESFPKAQITWAVEARYAELLEGNPFVTRLARLDTLGWRTRPLSAQSVREVKRELVELRRPRPHVAIDFQGLLKSAMLARLSGAPERLGLEERWLREPMAATFYTERVSARGRLHAVEENLALVERLGARPIPRERWQFPLPRVASAEKRVEERLAALGLGKFLVINPGGGWMSKRWAPEEYAELLRELDQDGCCPVLLTGSAGEEPMIHGILERAGARHAAYFPSTLVEFIALARRARLFVGGDTGPLHLAAAVSTPIVAIYGPTDPARNGPFASGDLALSSHSVTDHPGGGAHWHQVKREVYVEGIPVEAVRTAIRKRLADSNGAQ
jgi:heptosyltransferase I